MPLDYVCLRGWGIASPLWWVVFCKNKERLIMDRCLLCNRRWTNFTVNLFVRVIFTWSRSSWIFSAIQNRGGFSKTVQVTSQYLRCWNACQTLFHGYGALSHPFQCKDEQRHLQFPRFHQPKADSHQCSLGSIFHTQFYEHITHVALHRHLSQNQLRGNFFIAHASCKQF